LILLGRFRESIYQGFDPWAGARHPNGARPHGTDCLEVPDNLSNEAQIQDKECLFPNSATNP
jgi:hypothetical protein